MPNCRQKGVNPTLGIIRVGENPSDISYEKGATKRCETLGLACEKILLPEGRFTGRTAGGD